jgi:hypothetical protein
MHPINLLSGIFIHAHHQGLNIGHMVTSSVIHGLIYGVIFKALHGLSFPVVALIAVSIIGLLWFFFRRK